MIKYFVAVFMLFAGILPTLATKEIGLEILDTCLSEVEPYWAIPSAVCVTVCVSVI